MIYVDMKGTNVPALGFGTWQLTDEGCTRAVLKALEVGYRHIDTAQIYKNEGEVGHALTQSGVARDELFVTTKVWVENAKAARVRNSVEESLEKLQLEHVDLLLLHWPTDVAPLKETLGAMSELQKAGKTRFIGVSNFPVKLMQEAIDTGYAIACNQVEYHVQLPQKQVLDFARAHDIIVTAYSPLGRAKLTQHPVLTGIGEKYGKSAAQVALRWLLEQKNVMAIPKATREENIRQNFALFDFQLDNEDRDALAALGTGNRLVNPSWAPEWDKAA